MANEIEAKIKVDDLAVIRKRLQDAGAKPKGTAMEINTFFDTPQKLLQIAGKGLRTRTAAREDGTRKYTITLKGPLQKGELKTREEIELVIDDPDSAGQLFENLGFVPNLSFEKRRESWEYLDCKIELDEMPYLGTFVEIEATSDAKVMAAMKALRLSGSPLITKGYAALLADYLTAHHITDRQVRLAK